MKIRDLLGLWQTESSEKIAAREFTIRLALHDAARVMALTQLYPGRSETQLIRELLSTALDELEAAFPYIKGDRIIADDEYGDPIYEDSGLTPRFHELTQKYLRQLERQE